MCLFSGFNKVPKVPSGNLLKPSLVGAKTVNGPSEESASTNSPACTAATNVEKLSFETLIKTIFGLTELFQGKNFIFSPNAQPTCSEPQSGTLMLV